MNKYSEHSKAGKARKDIYRKISRNGFAVCAKKRAFDTESQAVRFLSVRGYSGKPYMCKHCNKWHNTSKG